MSLMALQHTSRRDFRFELCDLKLPCLFMCKEKQRHTTFCFRTQTPFPATNNWYQPQWLLSYRHKQFDLNTLLTL